MYFYEILQSIMEEKNLSIPEVARLSGLTDSTVRSMIARKNKTVALEVAFKLAKGLNVPLEELNGELSTPLKKDSVYLLKDEKELLSNYRLLPLPEKDGACAYMERLAKPYKENSEKASEAPTKGDSYLSGVYGQAAAFGGDSARIPVPEENLKELLRRSAKEDKKEL